VQVAGLQRELAAAADAAGAAAAQAAAAAAAQQERLAAAEAAAAAAEARARAGDAELEAARRGGEVRLSLKTLMRTRETMSTLLSPSRGPDSRGCAAAQEAAERAAAAEASTRDLGAAVARLEAHAADLESRKRAPLYQKRQEEELAAAVAKAADAEGRAAAAEGRAKDAKARPAGPLTGRGDAWRGAGGGPAKHVCV